MIGPLGIAGDAVAVNPFVNVVEGWKLATLAFIVGLVAAGVVTLTVGVVTLGNCGAAAGLAVSAVGSENEASGGDTRAVCCAGTGCSLEVPASTFLTAEPLATLPGLADDPLASDGTEASVRPDTLGVIL